MIFIVSSRSSLRGSDDSCAADVLQLQNYFPAGRRSQACNRIRGGAEYSPLRHDHIEIAAFSRSAFSCAGAVVTVALEHDPEKWEPVFRQDHAENEES
ncbi:MAG: hypothetical protein ACXWLZ_11775 [Rhizomicrobium sp.]